MKILMIDDHVVVREGVRRLLQTVPGASIVEASDADEAMTAFREEQPDIVLLDLNLPGVGGLELLRRLKGEKASVRVIIFSMHADPLYASRALQSGARGYVSKGASAEELVLAVQRVAEGGRYVDREIASELAIGQSLGQDPMQQLTMREIEILRLLGEGRSLSGIAEALGVAYKTIANSCALIKDKLGVDRTADLIRLSIERRRG
jgi:two-component system invasion response regulator UvrY